MKDEKHLPSLWLTMTEYGNPTYHISTMTEYGNPTYHISTMTEYGNPAYPAAYKMECDIRKQSHPPTHSPSPNPVTRSKVACDVAETGLCLGLAPSLTLTLILTLALALSPSHPH